MVIERSHARLIACYGVDVVPLPSRATAYRLLEELERNNPTFRLSSKRNQDIARRPVGCTASFAVDRVAGRCVGSSTAVNWWSPTTTAEIGLARH
jgi:hypothetical protein